MTTLALVAMIAALLPAFVVAAAPAGATDDHPLLCEAVVTPTASEFIEIVNPGATPIDLTNYYLTDLQTYALLPTGTPSIDASDFVAQFPAGATLPAGGVAVIAFDGAGFAVTFGSPADYEIHGTHAATPDMMATAVGSTAGLTNAGENAVLFFWDGASDLVSDVDMLNIGAPTAPNSITNKTGLSVDGPDADTVASTYATDAFTMPQQAANPGFGFSTKRVAPEAGYEATGGGNGITGDDETTEMITTTWDGPTFTAPTPGLCDLAPAPAVAPGDLVINEVDYDQPDTDEAEYVEIKNVTGAAIDLTGVSLVFASGTASSVYDTIGLSGTLAAGDYYVVCGNAANVANCDLDDGPDSNFIQNGSPDAMAIFFEDFVIDALSYEGDAAAPYIEGSGVGLEDIAADPPTGLSRCTDGTDTDQNNVDFLSARPITPGETNDCPVEPAEVLVINEIMANPAAVSDGVGEWFEVYNPTETAIDINGWTISDDDFDSHMINNGGPLVVPAGGYLVLGNNADTGTNGGLIVDYDYGNSWFLGNSGDEVVLTDDSTTEVDRVAYFSGSDTSGASLALIDPALDNSVASVNWCTSGTPYGDGDLGTPGDANICPSEFELVINEIMQNPSAVLDTNGEWFELYNPTGEAIDIEGWTIRDAGSDSHVIENGGPLLVPAGGYLVLARNVDSGANGGVTAGYQYSGLFLGNSDDEVIVEDGLGFEVDRVEYDGGPAFPDPNGASMALKLPAADNNVGVSWCTASTPFGGGDFGTPGEANDCPPTFIHEVQGSGPAVAIGGAVEIEAIVVADYQGGDQLRGFFVQEEDADANLEGDPDTSEGIFVYCGGCDVDVSVGDLVGVIGVAGEYFGMSQIDADDGGSVVVVSSGNQLPTPATIDLPASGSTRAEETFESVEGMLVRFADTLAVSEYFYLARYGELLLTADERPRQFTDEFEPNVVGYSAFLDELNSSRIFLDDDNNIQNDPLEFDPNDDAPYFWPRPGLSTTNYIRGGDTITGLTGVLHWSYAGQEGTDAWRVRPVDAAFTYDFTPVDDRTEVPEDVGGTLKVASFNVLNYFTTIGSRGADSVAELDRQRAKISAAICGMDADVVGLIEIENNGSLAIIDLLEGPAGVNERCGDYAFVDTGPIGTDEIAVAFIYRPSTVTAVGDYAILDFSVDPRFNDDRNRPALAQTFEENATGGVVTVVVNHLKSKGSPCDDIGDPDVNDGQGNCNLTRTSATEAMVDWLAVDPTWSGDADVLIIGDLNAYRNEDPIDAIEAGSDDTSGTADDYTDLLDSLIGPPAYSYLFDGQLGYLDHSLANAPLVEQVTGVTVWHINADEIPVLDYNDGIEDPGEAWFERESTALPIYTPDAYRASDHDPTIVGLELDTAFELKDRALETLSVLEPADRATTRRINNAIDRVEESLTEAWWDGDSTIETHKVFDQERRAIVQLELVVASAAPEAAVAQAVIDELVEADRMLAQVAIYAAIAGGGDPVHIALAYDYLAMAAADRAAGLYNEAVNNYKEAWLAAVEALE